jgi:hypothetical protein
MQLAGYESLMETPPGVPVATAVGLVSTVSVVVVALGVQGLAVIGLLLILPGCGQPI